MERKTLDLFEKKGIKIDKNYRRDKVTSSQIKEIAFDKTKGILYIVFSNSSIYSYTPFDESQYDKLLNSSSIGSYFHKNIKNNKKLIYKNI